jgi:hypothetical protein
MEGWEGELHIYQSHHNSFHRVTLLLKFIHYRWRDVRLQLKWKGMLPVESALPERRDVNVLTIVRIEVTHSVHDV